MFLHLSILTKLKTSNVAREFSFYPITLTSLSLSPSYPHTLPQIPNLLLSHSFLLLLPPYPTPYAPAIILHHRLTLSFPHSQYTLPSISLHPLSLTLSLTHFPLYFQINSPIFFQFASTFFFLIICIYKNRKIKQEYQL